MFPEKNKQNATLFFKKKEKSRYVQNQNNLRNATEGQTFYDILS